MTEQLLRKTTAKQVNDLYEKFFAVFPSFVELAQSPKGKIKNIIRPLGLQNQRAELLHVISTRLVELERVPKEENQLLSLPGVGQYCADALRCLAFGEDVPMVDRNVVRVINRVFSVLPRDVNPLSEKAAKTCRSFVEELLPKGNSKSYNLGLLDFAASICLATKPKCAICPVLSICNYGSLNLRHARAFPNISLRKSSS